MLWVYFFNFKGSRHVRGFLNLSSVLASYWGLGGGGTGGGAFGKNRNDILFNFFNYFFFNFFLFIIFQVNGEDRGFTTQWW